MRRKPEEIQNAGPWWSHTWWGKRTTAVNVTITCLVLLAVLWAALYR